MKKEKKVAETTKQPVETEVEMITRGIKAVREHLDKLESDIKEGKAEDMSIFCVIGNIGTDSIETVIQGSNKNIILTLANVLEGKDDLWDTIERALFFSLVEE